LTYGESEDQVAQLEQEIQSFDNFTVAEATDEAWKQSGELGYCHSFTNRKKVSEMRRQARTRDRQK
jgi:hypothetical protein